MKLTPYLHFAGNAEEALNFYKEALGGEIIALQRYGDSPMPVDEDYKQKVIHARLTFGDNMIMVSDVFKGQPVSTEGNIQLSVEVPDRNQMETVFTKMAAGGKVVMPLQDQFWGAYFGMLQDPFGVSWMFNCEQK
ncbi:VOC family protein [Deminuibacter soli]|uniref:VOC family protein n=1 Tax=Deminuibacter soli TaxID=2291815 RepID=A0A3E1NNV5_9BACT|nr:glyoxalase/bleomycin resistance/extradiol dioxygenase family protein [Deminuibacter soli]RFM29616.1 VOC family protein [Deminuibacter soli]